MLLCQILSSNARIYKDKTSSENPKPVPQKGFKLKILFIFSFPLSLFGFTTSIRECDFVEDIKKWSRGQNCCWRKKERKFQKKMKVGGESLWAAKVLTRPGISKRCAKLNNVFSIHCFLSKYFMLLTEHFSHQSHLSMFNCRWEAFLYRLKFSSSSQYLDSMTSQPFYVIKKKVNGAEQNNTLFLIKRSWVQILLGCGFLSLLSVFSS